MEPEVTILCKRTAVSSESMRPLGLRLLSALDRAGAHYRIRAAYYYARCPPLSGIGSSSGELKESLAEVLNSFRTVTGRLQRTEDRRWALDCNDSGLRMVEATAEGSVEDWLRDVDRDREMKLIFWEDMYEKYTRFWSPFYVQLTRFQGGGLAVGISGSHMLADAVSVAALVTAWADTNLLGKMLSPPSFEPLLPPPLAGDDWPSRHLVDSLPLGEYETESTNEGGFATASFAFSDAAARSVLAAAGGSSVFGALAALFWTAISRAKKGKGKEKQGSLVDMAVCVDARGALNLSRSFFGNATVFAPVHGGNVKEGTLAEAARAVADAVSEIDYQGVMQWLEEGAGAVTSLCGTRLVCANWEGLNTNSAVFERGEGPLRVSYHLEPVSEQGHVLVMPPSALEEEPSLARLVAVTLRAAELARLREDGIVLGYQPSVSPSKCEIRGSIRISEG